MCSHPSFDSLLHRTREAYRHLLLMFAALDQQIATAVPEWDPADRFCALLSSVCVDLALLMLGADRRFEEIEMAAFNGLFVLDLTPETIAGLAAQMQEAYPDQALLFARLDQWMLAAALAERAPGQPRLVEPTLDFLMALAEFMALVDSHYALSEHRVYQQLLSRIRHDWGQLAVYLPETEPALMLTLRDGRKQIYALG